MVKLNLTIRKANLEDVVSLQKLYQQVDRLHYRVLPEIFNPVDECQRSPSWFKDTFEDNTCCMLVAEYRQQILGLIEVQICQTKHPLLKPRKYGHIRDVVVDRAWRRQGVGKKLMHNAYQWAQQQGASSVEVVAFSFNQEALSFYRNLGYVDSDITLRNTF